MTETLADLYEARFGEATELGRDRPAEGEIARQLAHRSHRRWSDKPVDPELLQLLFAAALSIRPSPISCNTLSSMSEQTEEGPFGGTDTLDGLDRGCARIPCLLRRRAPHS